MLPSRDDAAVDVGAETQRAAAALDTVGAEIEALAQRAGVSGAVLVRQARIARDPSLGALAAQLVRTGRPAARATWEAFGAYRDMRAADPMRAVPDRAELDDVRDRVVALLLGEPAPGIPDPGTPFVLVARDLSPAVTAGLDPKRVLAIVTERGGPTSHTAVLAKSLGIPAVVGCPGVASLRSGQRVLVDGRPARSPRTRTAGRDRPRGAAAVVPGGSGAAEGDDAVPARAGSVTAARCSCSPPSVASLTWSPPWPPAPKASGCSGPSSPSSTGRSRRASPSRPTAYREVFDAFAGTAGDGADARHRRRQAGGVPAARRPAEPSARHPRPAGRAAAPRAAGRPADRDRPRDPRAAADVRVMAPMVATPAEAAWFAAQARQAGVTTTGVMVEVPAAALRAADILQVVDFVSVGSNDLAQYAFATDRADGELSDLLDPWQPAFLDLVATVLRAGSRRRTVGHGLRRGAERSAAGTGPGRARRLRACRWRRGRWPSYGRL